MSFDVLRINGLSIEMSVLALGIVIGLLHLFGQAGRSDLERGIKWALGPRDTKKDLSLIGQRFERAANNFNETFPFVFAALVLIEISGQSNSFTQGAAIIWLFARALYYPAYVLGWPIRSYAWGVAIFALIGMIGAIFL